MDIKNKDKDMINEDEIAGSDQYLTFILGQEAFAIEISKVREVVDYTEITRVPRMPEYLKGVINLRGNVVSVIDLRLILGMTPTEKTIDTCIVIAEINVDGEMLQMGILTDAVQEVISLPLHNIEHPPRVGTRLKSEFIQGIGKRNDSFIIILNIDRVLSREELAALEISGENMMPEDSEPVIEL